MNSGTGAKDERLLVARAIRILHVAGVMDMNGHVALRDAASPSSAWINSRRASRSTLAASDVVRLALDEDHRPAEGAEPPSELHIHRAIFRRRPDVGAVVHSHPRWIVTLSIAGRQLMPVSGIGSFLPEATPVFDDANLINTATRGEAVAERLGGETALVLRGHGVVIVGSSVEEAVARTICAEENARMQFHASVLGDPLFLRGAELLAVRRETWTPAIVAKHWQYHEQTARRAGALDDL